MFPGAVLVDRFESDLRRLISPHARVGLAVSGGPDSTAMLLLAAAARPGRVEAATVDHQLRPEARSEADQIAELCDRVQVQHRTLVVNWREKPQSAVQERARLARYRLLEDWALEQGLEAVVTAHHLDDQAETLLMRLNRGSGVRGLAGMRPLGIVLGGRMPLLRPLLRWRRSELHQICADAGIDPAFDPSNEDEQFERVRVRQGLAAAEWIDPEGVAAAAAHLGEAHAALNWASAREWEHRVVEAGPEIVYRPLDAPSEIRRRIVARAVRHLATEGRHAELRGRELDQLMGVLADGGKATIRGVACSGGREWRFAPARARRR